MGVGKISKYGNVFVSQFKIFDTKYFYTLTQFQPLIGQKYLNFAILAYCDNDNYTQTVAVMQSEKYLPAAKIHFSEPGFLVDTDSDVTLIWLWPHLGHSSVSGPGQGPSVWRLSGLTPWYKLRPNNKYHSHSGLIEAHCLQMDSDIRADQPVKECEKQGM